MVMALLSHAHFSKMKFDSVCVNQTTQYNNKFTAFAETFTAIFTSSMKFMASRYSTVGGNRKQDLLQATVHKPMGS